MSPIRPRSHLSLAPSLANRGRVRPKPGRSEISCNNKGLFQRTTPSSPAVDCDHRGPGRLVKDPGHTAMWPFDPTLIQQQKLTSGRVRSLRSFALPVRCSDQEAVSHGSQQLPGPGRAPEVLQLGDQEVDHRAGTGSADGTDRALSRRLLGCAGPGRRCVVAKRFRRAGLARTSKDRLDAGYGAGLPFDLPGGQFVHPLAVGLASRDPGDAVGHGSSTPVCGTAAERPMVRLSAHREPSGRQWLTQGPPGTVPVGGQASGSSKIVR